MTVALLGAHVLLQVGSAVPLPAPFPVMDALRSMEVQCGSQGRDGFQMSLAIARDTPLDASLVATGLLDPPNRVVITVVFGGIPEVIMDGVITHVQLSVSPTPGECTYHITGEDLSVMMDLEERNRTFELLPDSAIVLQLLQPYIARYGIVPQITPVTNVPLPTERMPSQQGTDLSHIRYLAERNGFVFYVEPMAPGVSRAYFGPELPVGVPQPAINVGLTQHRATTGPLQGSFNALSPATPRVTITEPNTGVGIPITVPNLTAVPPTVRPAQALRTTIARGTAGRNAADALLEGVAAATHDSDPVSVSGEIDGVRYGQVLRARRMVGLRGMGLTWDGLYKVSQVTHRIQLGDYKQSFTLKRGGFVSPVPVVVP